MKSINYFKAEVSTERQNGKYLRLGQTGNTNKSPLHFLCRTQCGSMGPCCTKRSHAHGTKTPCWRANNAVWPCKLGVFVPWDRFAQRAHWRGMFVFKCHKMRYHKTLGYRYSCLSAFVGVQSSLNSSDWEEEPGLDLIRLLPLDVSRPFNCFSSFQQMLPWKFNYNEICGPHIKRTPCTKRTSCSLCFKRFRLPYFY